MAISPRKRAQGIEANWPSAPFDQSDLSLAYSLIDTRDRSPGSRPFDQHLSRRPVHGLSASIDKAWRFGLRAVATLRTASASVDPIAPQGSLDGYALLDLRASLPIRHGIALYGRLGNAFDRHYETACGYATYGWAAYGGLRIGL
jgi:vitamin B12 transporter